MSGRKGMVVPKRQGRGGKWGRYKWLAAVGLGAALLGLALLGIFSPSKRLPPPSPPASSNNRRVQGYAHDGLVVEPEDWEPEFDAALWTAEVIRDLTRPPFLFESEGALVKEVANQAGQRFRVLMFDRSGEVQGAIALRPDSDAPNFSSLVLEYIRSMAYGLMFQRNLSCKAPGHALVLGLGAGSMANLIHSTFSEYVVDVAEVSEDVRHAATKVLGTPANDERLVIYMRGAEQVLAMVPAERMYDLVVMDAYLPGPRIPPQLETAEFVSSLAARMSPTGVLVLNFCLPFYSKHSEQERVLRPYRDAFRHLHMIESTPTSKILVAYNTEGPPQTRQQVLRRMEEASRGCGFPSEVRAKSYELYLKPDSWLETWLRPLHEEATKFFCDTRQRLNPSYCSWFMPRHKLSQLFPMYHFGGPEQNAVLSQVNDDFERAKKVLEKRVKNKK